MKEYKIYPAYGFGNPDFSKIIAIFYDLNLAKDFVSYQMTLGKDFAITCDGKIIEDEI